MQRHTGIRHVAAALTLALSLAACMPSGASTGATSSNVTYRFVKSPDGTAFFKVPAGWHLFNKQQLLVASDLNDSPQANNDFKWLIAFDADPNADVNDVTSVLVDQPVVHARVQLLPDSARDAMSIATMRNSVFPFDQLQQKDQAEILSYRDLVQPDGMHGIQIVYQIAVQGTFSVSNTNKIVRIDQISLVDPATKFYYLFFVTCQVDCYQSHQAEISAIADSWTVKEP